MNKKIYLLIFCCAVTVFSFAQTQKQTEEQKKQKRKERINQLMKQEEEGTLIYSKQNAFGIKLNTDGYGIFYEHGKYQSITKTSLWWLELSERKNTKEEKKPITDATGFFILGNPFIFGKVNNFYYLNLGIAQQLLIGGKGNKNGVAVSLIYGGGISAGLLKPYYLSVTDSNGNNQTDVKAQTFYDSLISSYALSGASSFTKGFNQISFVPGVQARVALRFDYGRYNELLSAIEVGVNASYYTKNMQIMLDDPGKKFFFNAYVALVFGKRK
ncbi:MAG: hypothetical protein ACR2FN_06125 [Chitinophagaceae bacterium]